MENKARIAEQLRVLGERLVVDQPGIMRAWRGSVTNDPELTTARTLSRSRFDDYIPALLKAFSRQLSAWPGEGIVAAEAEQEQRGVQHGAHRWQEGYALPEVAREWIHLQLALLDAMEQYAATHSALEPSTMVIARRSLALLCGDGVSRSVAEYTRLMQAQAAGRVSDLESALAELNELQRQRAEAWREAAHDLRDTVGMVSNATGLLRREDAPDRLRAKSLATLQTGVSSLGAMLNDLLSLARLEAGLERREVAPFDAGVLLSALCDQLQAGAAACGLGLRAEGPPNLAVEGDEVKTRRIAQNLLTNALRYTQQGGVTVNWEPSEQGDFHRWVLTVQDTGPGAQRGAQAPLIDELQRIGESARSKVEQLHPGGPAQGSPASPPRPGGGHGEGIGLSIVKHLCQLLDATLEFETNPAGGSTFRVVFPRRYGGQ